MWWEHERREWRYRWGDKQRQGWRRAGETREDIVCRQKPWISFSLISYLQTGAWQGRTCEWEGKEAGRGRVGTRKRGRPSERIKEGHAIPLASPLVLSPLHWSGNDRFHSCFRSWRGEVVSDYQGGAGGCDVELRPECRTCLDSHDTHIRSEQCHVCKPGGDLSVSYNK